MPYNNHGDWGGNYDDAYTAGYDDGSADASNYQKVREFHKAFNADLDKPIVERLVDLRWNLIEEECYEIHKEIADEGSLSGMWIGKDRNEIDKAKLAKELADLLYVTYGTAATFGIDIDRVFDEVHKSNMSKLGEDGKPVYREDGKVLKGPNYQPPKLDWITK